MNIHKNARLTPTGRALLVSRVETQGWTVKAASLCAGVSNRTGSKWLSRYRKEGDGGLTDRSSAPVLSPRRIAGSEVLTWESLRRQRWPQWRIARQGGRALSTVSRAMKTLGLSRLKSLEPPIPIVRYERELPGELIHIDIKKLGKVQGVGHRVTGVRKKLTQGSGWEAVHLAIDDRSRVAFAMVMPDETKGSCIAFLRATVGYYAGLGVPVQGVMTDNGAGYRSLDFKTACQELGIKHIRTRPYTPRTNGKAERFVQTSLREWAYAKPYQSSQQRTQELGRFLNYYNWDRPHTALGYKPPVSRLGIMNNVLECNN